MISSYTNSIKIYFSFNNIINNRNALNYAEFIQWILLKLFTWEASNVRFWNNCPGKNGRL